MIKAFMFTIKYKILKDPINLSYHTKEFFELSKNTQRKVLDKYFNKLKPDFPIDAYFNTKESRYFKDNKEITFFHCYYFDKKIIEHNIYNIKLVDKFKLETEKINYLIDYTLKILKENSTFQIEELLQYPDKLPVYLSKNIEFMTYIVNKNCYDIKYLTYNPECASRQRELIKQAIEEAKKKEFHIKYFLKQDNILPPILINNMDFLLYLIENDIENIHYLNEKILDNLTITNKNIIIKTIIESLKNHHFGLEKIENNPLLSEILNKNQDFISYMISISLENIRYIDWHNITDNTRTQIINQITTKIKEEKIDFDIMKYPFRNLFFQNYQFMSYLIEQDFRWITVSSLNSKEDTDKLIHLFFEKQKEHHYKFKLTDFLQDGKYLNPSLIENKKMVHYLFNQDVPFVQHLDFFHLKSSRTFVENLLNELEKTPPEYEFHNEWYLINGKYPIPFSNSYRFMRYVIDKNFNNIAYIDPSMIDKRELKRIINYAFRMVYFIRGNNKKLNFDLDGYFQNTDIIKDEYFQECLKSL